MIKNRNFVESIISKRNDKEDYITEFAVRNKDSPAYHWESFKPYREKEFYLNLFTNIDGVKLKFRYVTLTINVRY